MSAKNNVQDECGDSAAEYWPTEPTPRFAKGTRNDIWIGQAEASFPHLGELDLLAHDLRNPLAAISLEAALVGERLGQADHEAMRRGLHRIQRNAEYLARMVEDLLDLGAIDHGHLRIRHAPTELRGLLEQVIDRAIAPVDRGRVILDAPQPITVTIDAVRIERVVANLLQNALKYAPGQSTVVALGLARGLARVSVADEGPGIDPAEQTSIFDKYQRGTTAGASEGCGLGLYVSRCIVEAHGGHIAVEGRRGGGSCFYFELPLG
jgi:signal transduction histidine kinase